MRQHYFYHFQSQFYARNVIQKINLTQFTINYLNLEARKSMNNFQRIIHNNKQWSQEKLAQDKTYFIRNADSQSPKYLFIGCSDSRIPAETILGLEPGQIFVHRNIANQVELSDVNTLSVVQYAVEVLKVQDIIITGHYGCGGVKAAMTKQDFGPMEAWLSHIRSVRIRFRNQLHQSEQENFNLLCELNVKSQVYDMAKIPSVQKAWVKGQPLRIHGLIYRLEDGILKDLGLTLDRIHQIPEEFWIYSPEQEEGNFDIKMTKPLRKSSHQTDLNSSIDIKCTKEKLKASEEISSAGNV